MWDLSNSSLNQASPSESLLVAARVDKSLSTAFAAPQHSSSFSLVFDCVTFVGTISVLSSRRAEILKVDTYACNILTALH